MFPEIVVGVGVQVDQVVSVVIVAEVDIVLVQVMADELENLSILNNNYPSSFQLQLHLNLKLGQEWVVFSKYF
jgi:hypothetical protein